MKIILKIVYILAIIMIIQITLTKVQATDSNTGFTMDSIIDSGESFLAAKNKLLENNASNNAIKAIDEGSLKNTSTAVYNVLFTIGVALATIIGMVIGIQFMMGSPEEQAKVKETLVPYVIGVFVIFGAFGIWRIVIGIGNSL